MTKNIVHSSPVDRFRERLSERREWRRQRREHDMAMSIPGVAAEHDAMVRRSGSGCPFCN